MILRDTPEGIIRIFRAARGGVKSGNSFSYAVGVSSVQTTASAAISSPPSSATPATRPVAERSTRSTDSP